MPSTENFFMVIRRKKRTIFLDVPPDTVVEKVKKMVEGIIKVGVDDFVLVLQESNKILDDLLSIEDCGLNHVNATAQNPATVRLVYKEGDVLEQADIQEYSTPPDLPDAMKPLQGGEVEQQ